MVNFSRDTLHDFSLDYVRLLAEVFGWRIVEAKGAKRGPDVIIEHIAGDAVDAVMFVESEVGHDQGSAKAYFEELARRLKPLVEDYRSKGRMRFSIVIITTLPEGSPRT